MNIFNVYSDDCLLMTCKHKFSILKFPVHEKALSMTRAIDRYSSEFSRFAKFYETTIRHVSSSIIE